jgi:TctA family transporter
VRGNAGNGRDQNGSLRPSPWCAFDVLLGLICTDVNSDVIRFAFGQPELADRLGFVALAMAFFGIAAGPMMEENLRRAMMISFGDAVGRRKE